MKFKFKVAMHNDDMAEDVIAYFKHRVAPWKYKMRLENGLFVIYDHINLTLVTTPPRPMTFLVLSELNEEEQKFIADEEYKAGLFGEY